MARTAKNRNYQKNQASSLPFLSVIPTAKLDETDYQILWHLDFEARESLTSIGEKVGISKQLLKYRIERLKDQGVIKNAFAILDIHRLGLSTYRIYYRFSGIDRKKEQELIKEFVDHDNTLWVASLEGPWDMEVVYVARNYIHFNQIYKEIHYKIGKYIRKQNISCSPVHYQLRRDYLISKTRKTFSATFYGFEPAAIDRDEMDYKILTELSINCQQTDDEMAKKIGISNSALARRIEMLEKDMIVRAYRQSPNLESLGRAHYKALLNLRSLSPKIEKEIYSFCSKNSSVAFFTEVVGEWQLEVEAEMFDEKEIFDLTKELRAEYNENVEDFQIVKVAKEHKLNYLPTGKITRNIATNHD